MDCILKSARGCFLEFLEWNRAIYVLLAVGLALRILALSLVAHVPLRNEAPGYMMMATQLLHRQSFAPYWPPGVPYYLFFVQKLFGESLLVARASILPIYAAFTAFLFIFVRRVATLRAANVAALIFVFYPPYVRDSFNPSTEYPAAACVMARSEMHAQQGLARPNLTVEQRLEEINQLYPSDYFIVTEMGEYQAQNELGDFLIKHFPLLVRDERYLVFDLRSRLPMPSP